MKQGVLAGCTEGLRPAERRRLEGVCHRRHPPDALADALTLQRLGEECRRLALPLTLVVDGRGLCRLLWVGDLLASGRLIDRLPGSSRRRGHDLRLITCAGTGRHPLLQPDPREAIVGLDLAPLCWLRYGPESAPGGDWPAALCLPQPDHEQAWDCLRRGDLADLCRTDPSELLVGSTSRRLSLIHI